MKNVVFTDLRISVLIRGRRRFSHHPLLVAAVAHKGQARLSDAVTATYVDTAN